METTLDSGFRQAMATLGDDALARLAFADLYQRLRRMARSKLREHGAGNVVNTTTLVHEAWLKLEQGSAKAEAYSLALAARAMRFALVDLLRSHLARKRGGDVVRVTMQTGNEPVAKAMAPADMLAIERSLEQLEAWEPRLARVVECRYYGGMVDSEIGAALGIDERTVRRDWVRARAFLLARLGGEVA